MAKTTFVVESFYGGHQPSSARFDSYAEAKTYADTQCQAMPRWYTEVQIIKVTEEVIESFGGNLWQPGKE